jgi:hypothetical protein
MSSNPFEDDDDDDDDDEDDSESEEDSDDEDSDDDDNAKNDNGDVDSNDDTAPQKSKSSAAGAKQRGSVQAGIAARLFGGNDQLHLGEEITLEDDEPKRTKTIAQWPYDDYHHIQQKYYEVVDAKMDEEEDTPSYLVRPDDLQDIPSAVEGLPLIDFGTEAEKRAIGIVSTWIFDAGLIDELISDSNMPVSGSEDVKSGDDVHAAEGSQKFDKEIEKLKESTTRELALINARLNDGVAASGSEVQELVNAVTATKGDLQRLKLLTEYISNGGDLEQTHTFLLTNYPKLKTAINARKNLARCFKELDFFSQIPATCDRLRDELNACEWTDHEWTTIRNVCREHVELQIFLVEAEAGMKNRMEEEDNEYNPEPDYNTSRGMRRHGNSFRYAPAQANHDGVDRFLSEHVKNVWELGDELQFRVLSGVGAAFDLAQANPEGMVALVEAVEVYESAADEFKREHQGPTPLTKSGKKKKKNKNKKDDERLSFTDMRRAALEKIAEDFESRGLDVFHSMQQKAADEAGDDDMEEAQFNAILRAANNLTYQMELVRTKAAPCFPPFWNVDTLWMTCVAAVCSKHIFEQIGGQEGENLEYMTVTQLLDLVAWIESFREKVEQTFPNIVKINTNKKTKLRTVKELLAGKEIDMESAKENLGSVINVLWDIHRLAQSQFILRTKTQTNGWLKNVYNADHANTQTTEGRLTTSLPEDVWALAGVQLRTIRERLTKKSSVLVDASSMVFRLLQLKQRETRSHFMTDIETCCAASNDFIRMTDQAELVLNELQSATELSDDNRGTLEDVANELMRQYSNDAVYAAQSVHKYVFQPIEEELADHLFEEDWERMGQSEMAQTLVRTIEDYMGDLEEWMEEIMVRKAVDALIKASVNFYIKRLLMKAQKKSAKDSSFSDNRRALVQIEKDIDVIQNFFEGQIETFPALERVIESEFQVLRTIHTLLLIAAGFDEDSAAIDELPAIQKIIRNLNITKFMVGDLWHLVNPAGEKDIYLMIDEHEDQLKAFDFKEDHVDEEHIDPTLQLDRVVINVVGNSSRKRPLKGDAAKQVGDLFGKWGTKWSGGGEKGPSDGDAAGEDDSGEE